VHAGHVIRAVRRYRVDQPQALLQPRIVHAELDALDLHREFFGAPPYAPGGGPAAVGENVADAFPARDELKDLEHGIGIAEAQVYAPRVIARQYPLLEALHGEGDGAAGRQRVQRIEDAQLVGPADGGEIVDAHERAEPCQRSYSGPPLLRSTLYASFSSSTTFLQRIWQAGHASMSIR